MGFQFIHVESYARVGSVQNVKNKKTGVVEQIKKKSMQDVADETDRKEDAIPHIDSPEPPVLLYGTPINDVIKEAENWADSAKDAQGRKLRKDAHCLLAGVISLNNQEKCWNSYKSAAIRYLQRKYGDRLKSVIEHTDENHPHIHFYVVPRVGEKFDSVHEGMAASNKSKAAGEVKGLQNQAYKAAMRSFQDDFSNNVAKKFGQTRIGPSRRRLTRTAWVKEQQQAKFFSDLKASNAMIYRKTYKKAKKDGFNAGFTESKQIGNRLKALGSSILEAFKDVFKSYHQPSQSSMAEAKAALEKLEAEKKKKLDEIRRVKDEAERNEINIANKLNVEILKRKSAEAEITKLQNELDDVHKNLDLYRKAEAAAKSKYKKVE